MEKGGEKKKDGVAGEEEEGGKKIPVVTGIDRTIIQDCD